MRTITKRDVARSMAAICLQLFSGIGTSINANAGAPRRNSRAPISVPIDTTTTPTVGPKANLAGGIAGGELIWWNAANKGVASLSTPGASNANSANCAGVAKGEYPYQYGAGINAGEPGSSPQGAIPYMDIYEDGDFLFNTTNAQSYTPYVALYLGADGRTISTTVLGSSIGYVSPDQRTIPGFGVAPPTFPITGAAGVQIYVRIKPALTGAS